MKSSMYVVFFVVLAASGFRGVAAFDDEELDVFDIVEEVNSNFYEFMDLKPDASGSEIRKAYRRLSLVLHPDKSDAPDAEVKFRWLVAIYEVLKDTKKREIYDRVLVEGLPDWRMPVFYYRRMRKMGLAEGLAYLSLIMTICQYCINWAAYWEKKFTLSEAVNMQMKKIQKKVKKGHASLDEKEVSRAMEEEKEKILGPKPTCFDTLPFQLFRLAKYTIVSIPSLPSTLYGLYTAEKEKKLAAERKKREEEEEARRAEEQKKNRKMVSRYEDRTGEVGDESDSGGPPPPPSHDAFKQPANALQVWTDSDLAKLARLMKKYPAGTPERWERIADIMERLPWEVTKMAKRVKDVAYQVPISKGAQGVTGLESERLVADDRMEAEARRASEEEDQEADSDDDSDYDEDDEDTDDENYGVYTVASKEEYVPPVAVREKKKTKGGKMGIVETDEKAADENGEGEAAAPTSDDWSQQQQVALESALQQFPKGSQERWERIASKVPGKTKEQCMVRFKSIAEMVKKKKQQNNAATA